MPEQKSAWVDLKHEETEHTHRFPNNPNALASAAERGWKPVRSAADSGSKVKEQAR